MQTIIIHEKTGIVVAVKSDIQQLHSMLKECSAFFTVGESNDFEIDEKYILEVGYYNNKYSIKNVNIVFNDIQEVLGTLMEIICCDFFLNSNDYIFIHGGVVEKNNKLSIVIASTMQGKSTLMALLSMSGYNYLSDDVIPINLHTLKAVSYPKIICLRDYKVLEKFDKKYKDKFINFEYKIKSIDNTTKDMEERDIILPYNSIKTSDINEYSIENIYFLNRVSSYMNDAKCEKIPNNISVLTIMKNLRSPNDLSKFRKIATEFIKGTNSYMINYYQGYKYLDYIL